MERNARLLALAVWLGCVAYVAVLSLPHSHAAQHRAVFVRPGAPQLTWMKPRQN